MCINRIRLEFKGLISFSLSAGTSVLIESDWNLKVIGAETLTYGNVCINRIRLEFKDKQRIQRFNHLIVLIESDWNLKLTSSSIPAQELKY